MSQLLLRTLREPPADAEAVSHQLLVRAGYIRRLASGVYTFLPLGLRVVRAVERIVQEEMEAVGAQEILMPVMQPVEAWEPSGRLATMDDVLFRVEGKGGRFVLGPTHEEVVTATVGAEIDSYRDLPVTVYQVQAKFRDEARPRYGLLRGREFMMKDAYSFGADQEAMRTSYRAMYEAYLRIFERCGLSVTPVEADAGTIGGAVNHEFMVPSAIGEDLFASCPECGYAANLEAARSGGKPSPAHDDGSAPAADEPLEKHQTPGRPGIDLVVDYFADRGLTASGMLKCIALVDTDDTAVIALVPGDRQVRVPTGMRPFADADFDRHPGLMKGYIGPMGLQSLGMRVIADPRVQSPVGWVTGANEVDHHVTGARLGRDFAVDQWLDLAAVREGDPCPECSSGELRLTRAVEAGHTFQLGLKYSSVIPGASFVAEDGREQPLWMGCYGIGISRLVGVIAEAHHDDLGLMWPPEVAPYQMHLIALGAARNPEVADAAGRLYADLTADGTAVLYDDRGLSAGVSFADADLLGLPVQIVVGGKGLARGIVERKDRRTGHRDELPLDGVARRS